MKRKTTLLIMMVIASCSLAQAQNVSSGTVGNSSTSAGNGGSTSGEARDVRATAAESSVATENSQTRYGPDSRACPLLPISELEAHFGGKAKVKGGLDDGTNAICTADVNGHLAKIQSAPPGTAGLPSTIQQGLAGVTMTAQGKNNILTIEETKDFGKVGCYTGKMTVEPFGNGQPLAKPIQTTVCFQVSGGYLTLNLTSEDPKQVSYEVVKGFLAKAAARRK